jgi:hypothetical protein
VSYCARCRCFADPGLLARSGGVCAQCAALLMATATASAQCPRCAGPRDRVDAALCARCRAFLAFALPNYERALQAAIRCGFTPQLELGLGQTQRQLGLADVDIAHLQPHIAQARVMPTYQTAQIQEMEARHRRQDQQRVTAGLQAFSACFAEAANDRLLTGEEWGRMHAIAAEYALSFDQALQFIRPQALELLERTVAFAADDGVLTEEEEQHILRLFDALQLSTADTASLRERLFRMKNIFHIRSGDLPLVADAGTYLESDESCHLKVEAGYQKQGARKSKLIPGRLIATTKRLYFASSTGGTQIPWKTVIGIERHRSAVLLELTQKSGAGAYEVDDPEMIEAILDTIVRIQKRRLLATAAEGPSRRIPHEVRLAVWHRDGAKCAECSATTYLEYDHIIPHSKGGASSAENVQLLCRRCNLKKSDRI